MLAAAMLAGSSLAFAADNKNNNDSVGKGRETTGSIKGNDAGNDSSDKDDIERCKMAVANDPTCVGVPRQ
jgi:hypothetical protein